MFEASIALGSGLSYKADATFTLVLLPELFFCVVPGRPLTSDL